MKFQPFPKIARWSRPWIITEKLDGTNASIHITPLSPEDGHGQPPFNKTAIIGDYVIHAGSRNRWITPEADNYGFARWVRDHAEELVGLGPGTHFGEWWGQGIQRNYGLKEKRFSLFNVSHWYDARTQPGDPLYGSEPAPECCHVVPVLYVSKPDCGISGWVDVIMGDLSAHGSEAAPGFSRPEGIVMFHTQGGHLYKKTFEKDEAGKGK